MYVCMYVFAYVYMQFECRYVRMYARMYVRMYVCFYIVCMEFLTFVYVRRIVFAFVRLQVDVCLCMMYVCMFVYEHLLNTEPMPQSPLSLRSVCMYVCMYVYIFLVLISYFLTLYVCRHSSCNMDCGGHIVECIVSQPNLHQQPVELGLVYVGMGHLLPI